MVLRTFPCQFLPYPLRLSASVSCGRLLFLRGGHARSQLRPEVTPPRIAECNEIANLQMQSLLRQKVLQASEALFGGSIAASKCSYK